MKGGEPSVDDVPSVQSTSNKPTESSTSSSSSDSTSSPTTIVTSFASGPNVGLAVGLVIGIFFGGLLITVLASRKGGRNEKEFDGPVETADIDVEQVELED
jgi:hypothetical protein